MWCGKYSKDDWTHSGGLHVKGVNDRGNRAVLQKGKCDPGVLHLVLETLKTEDIQGMGCLNFKYSGGHSKIYDWNMHQCGSMAATFANSRERLEQLLYSEPVEIGPEYTGFS